MQRSGVTTDSALRFMRQIEDDAYNGNETSISWWGNQLRNTFFSAMLKAWKNKHRNIAQEISTWFIFDETFLLEQAGEFLNEDDFDSFKFIMEHTKGPDEGVIDTAFSYASTGEYDTKYLEYLMGKYNFDATIDAEFDYDVSEIRRVVGKYGYQLVDNDDTYRLSKRRGRESHSREFSSPSHGYVPNPTRRRVENDYDDEMSD